MSMQSSRRIETTCPLRAPCMTSTTSPRRVPPDARVSPRTGAARTDRRANDAMVTTRSSARHAARDGAVAVAPMLIGIAPFGLVAGVAVAEAHLGVGVSIGLSTIVFAGASQLAMTHVLADGGSALVAVVAACTINLRMVLYSASLAPHLARERMGRRLIAAY